MDEVEDHRGRRPDEIVKPLNESGERRYADDAERGFRGGGHRLDATPGTTGEQELVRAPPPPCTNSVTDRMRRGECLSDRRSRSGAFGVAEPAGAYAIRVVVDDVVIAGVGRVGPFVGDARRHMIEP